MTDTQDLEIARQIKISAILGLRGSSRIIHTKCPFHQDSTPSFAIYPDNTYHCFGCEAHGNNAIDFVVAMGIPFKDAVSELISYRYPQS